jgi:hypothetical protein
VGTIVTEKVRYEIKKLQMQEILVNINLKDINCTCNFKNVGDSDTGPRNNEISLEFGGLEHGILLQRKQSNNTCVKVKLAVKYLGMRTIVRN